MADADTITAPIDFRIGGNSFNMPPAYDQILLQKFSDIIYNALQQIITQGLVNKSGIGHQPNSMIARLLNQVTTINAGNLTRLYRTATEDIAYGDLINLQGIGGVLTIRKASAADNSKPARGWCSEPAGIASGQSGEVQLGTGLIQLAATVLVPAASYFLSAGTPGALTGVVPSTAGNIVQFIGVALSPTTLYMNTNYWTQL